MMRQSTIKTMPRSRSPNGTVGGRLLCAAQRIAAVCKNGLFYVGQHDLELIQIIWRLLSSPHSVQKLEPPANSTAFKPYRKLG